MGASKFSRDVYFQLQRTIRRFQLKNRFTARAYDTELTLLESRILTDLSAQPGLLASGFAEKLALSRTAISRALARLTSKGLIKITPHKNDERRRVLQITARGFKCLAEFDRRSEERLAEFSQHVSAGDIIRLHRLLVCFADGLNAPPLGYEREEHPLRDPIRRLTQAMGLLGGGVFGVVELNSIEWHLLSELHERPGFLLARDLAQLFRVPANTISGLLSRLNQRGLLLRSTAAADRRKQFLRLSLKGEALLEKLERGAAQRLKSGLAAFSRNEISELQQLLAIFIGDAQDAAFQAAGLVQRPLINAEQRRLARAFCIREAVRLGLEEFIPQILYGERSTAFALYMREELAAVLEFQAHRTGAQYMLVNFVNSSELDGEPTLCQFVRSSTEELFRSGGRIVQIDDCWLKGRPLDFGRHDPALSAWVIHSSDDLPAR